MKNRFATLLCTGALLGSLAAAPAAAEEIAIGVLVTLSGPGSAWGLSMLSAAEFGAEDVNSQGGLKVGDKTYTVKVVSHDDKYKANDAVTGATRLIYEDKVNFMVGPMGSAPAVAVLPMTTENKLITMTMGFTPKVLDKAFTYSFRPVISTEEFSGPQVKWVVQKLGTKRVGGLFPNDESGQQVAEANAKAYEAAGAQFVSKEFFERDRVDFVPLLTRMLAQKLDAIELDGNSPTTAGLIVKQSRELGFTGPIIRTGGDATAEIIEVAGAKAADGLYVHQAINPADPKVQAHVKRYEAKYKGAMNAFAPYFYTNVKMVFAAMQKAGTVSDPQKIRDALAGLQDFDSVLGKVGWTGGGQYGVPHQMKAPFYIAQIKDAKVEIVATCTFEVCE